MKFTTLEVDNFLAITDAKVNLADRGLVLIHGRNLDDSSADSNGAGKSSLADAVNWVLYGETARGTTGDAVINEKAGKGTRVQIDIAEDDKTYRITRHRKHPKGKNGLTVQVIDNAGKVTDLTKGTDKLTQEVVNKIVGASQDVFRSSVYVGQEQMPDLPAMTDKNLKVLIEEASGVTLLEEAYREARDRLTAAKHDCDTIRSTVERYEEQGKWIEESIATTTALRDEWDRDNKTVIADSKIKLKEIVDRVKDLDAQIAKSDEKKLRDGIAACDRKLAALGDEQKKHRELSNKVFQASAKEMAAREAVREQKKRHAELHEELQTIEHKVGCPCGECGREITVSEIGAARATVQKRIDISAVELLGLEDALVKAVEATQELQGELKAFEASMTDPSKIGAKRTALQSALDDLGELKRERSIEASKAKNLGAEIKRLAAEPNPHEGALVDLQKKLEENQRVLDDLSSKLKDAETAQAIAESVVKVFSPAGVRAHILDEVTPYLNQQTAKYLETLSDGNIEAVWSTLVKNGKGELREKFSIEVTNDKGAKSFVGLSGGEKRKVRLAVALALQDLVATRATKPLDLFIGDEIDDALDPAGLERLTMILEEKARERGSVFIISHSDLRDWISNILVVCKEDGETTVMEETS